MTLRQFWVRLQALRPDDIPDLVAAAAEERRKAEAAQVVRDIDDTLALVRPKK